MKARYYGIIGVILLFIGSQLGGSGTAEDSQGIRGLGGIFVIVGLGMIVYALVKHYRKKT